MKSKPKPIIPELHKKTTGPRQTTAQMVYERRARARGRKLTKGRRDPYTAEEILKAVRLYVSSNSSTAVYDIGIQLHRKSHKAMEQALSFDFPILYGRLCHLIPASKDKTRSDEPITNNEYRFLARAAMELIKFHHSPYYNEWKLEQPKEVESLESIQWHPPTLAQLAHMIQRGRKQTRSLMDTSIRLNIHLKFRMNRERMLRNGRAFLNYVGEL